MKKSFIFLVLLLLAAVPGRAGMSVTPWKPIFKGIERSIGTNTPDAAIPRLQVVNCVRVDLSDPDVQLFTTPRMTNYVNESNETLSMTVSNFLKVYGLAVATDANFYNGQPGGSDPQSEGVRCNVFGLQISTGSVVSVPGPGPDASGRYASILFTTNKTPVIAFDNRPPGVDTTGIFTAVTGYYPIVSNGVNIGAEAAINYPDPTVHDRQPRTIIGVSQDRRYLFLITIDGRQGLAEGINPPYSDGAIDTDSAEWVLLLGGWDAVNMDGGGSTSMYTADCVGNPVAMNKSSYVLLRNRERYVGSHFGVFARPLPTLVKDLEVEPGSATAIITWKTDLPSSTQVEYGLTTGYGTATVFDPRPVTTHIVTLAGLQNGSKYFFRALSSAGGATNSDACHFATASAPLNQTLVFGLTNSWKFTTNNLDGTNWKSPAYVDSDWSGPSSGLFYIEGNTLVSPKSTLLPPGTSPVMRTYYFRTRFTVTGNVSGASIILSNYVDDGAVFYLNGAEIYRLRLPPSPTSIAYSTGATNQPCGQASGDATCPDVFTISGNLVTNLIEGDNLLAVEVHNYPSAASNLDIVYGSALMLNRPSMVIPRLNIFMEQGLATLYWNGEGFTLQASGDVSATNSWGNVSGAANASPVTVTNLGTTFYRLRK